MLKQIEITNFRSFKDTQIFTMEALPPSSLKEHPEHIIPSDGCGLLKLGSIYGPNGSGKSNLIHALSFFEESFNPHFGFAIHESLDNPFGGSDDKIVSLAYTFINEQYEMKLSFSYSINPKAALAMGIHYLSRDILPCIFVSEKLTFRKIGSDVFQTAYTREKGKIIADELLQEIGIKSFAVTNDQLLVNFIGSQYSTKGEYFRAVASCYAQINSIRRLGDHDIRFLEFTTRKTNCDYLASKLNAILGTNIVNIHFEKGDRGFNLNNLKFDHQSGDKTFTLSFYDESEGTQKLSYIIAGLKDNKNGRIYYADDFDSHLHPVLIQTLLSFLGSQENQNSQFVFNSHDILNMDSKYFRRDEIWFTTLNDDGSTRLYALSDLDGPDGRVIRKDAKYSRGYLEGKYGADPFIAKGLKL